MLKELLYLVGLTFTPFLELRASIPYGILALKMSWLTVFLICVTANFVIGEILYFLIEEIISVIRKIPKVEPFYQRYVDKTQHNIRKYVDKYGTLGVAIFIGIPLPGSGVYSAALGSYFIGLDYKRFTIANIIGVLIAGIAVTLVVLSGSQIFSWAVKMI